MNAATDTATHNIKCELLCPCCRPRGPFRRADAMVDYCLASSFIFQGGNEKADFDKNVAKE